MDYFNDPVLFPNGPENQQTAEAEGAPVGEPAAEVDGGDSPHSPAPEPASPPPAAKAPAALGSLELEAAFDGFILRIDDALNASLHSLQKAALDYEESAQAAVEAAADLAKADIRGVLIEGFDELGMQAGENITRLLAGELGAFADRIEKNTEAMLAATKQMHETAMKGPAIPSRFVWFVAGAAGFWFVTKYLDLARWAAIGEAVGKSLGVLK